VYSTLSRLEADGWVTSETVPQDLVPDRRVYTITEEGRQELKRWMAEPTEGPVRLRDEMFGKLLSSVFADEGDPLAFVWAQRRMHLQTLADLRHRKADPDIHPATLLVLDGAILRTEADLRWLDVCEERLRERNST
jgi:DNA-binding PadR family transcriptional regulator